MFQFQVWDDELAAAAQKWADSCATTHDTSRDVRKSRN